MELKNIRNHINEIDDKIFELYQERMELSARVAKEKKDKNLPLTNKKREREILSRMSKKSEELMLYTRMLYNTLFSISKSYQNKLIFKDSEFSKSLEEAVKNTPRVFPNKGAIAVQGREGSYSQQACDKLFPMGDIMYFKSFGNVFDAVNEGLCDFGILPIENSSNGSIKEVYDLMMEKNFYIVRTYKDNNYTRFICIAKDMNIYPGSEKISLMLTTPHEPGGLYNIMAKFAALGVNITKLESRPMVGSDFEFMFYFDFEGSVESKDIREMIDELSRTSEEFAFLGNYQEY